MSEGATRAGALIRAGVPAACRPWPRFTLSSADWFLLARMLPDEPGLAFVALWADAGHVHALFQGEVPVVVSTAVEAGLFAALSPARPGAALFERAVADLWGHQAADAVDVRPWLDHGTWPLLRPMSDRPVPNAAAPAQAEPDVPEMIDGPGDAVPFGPLSPAVGLAGPAHWRLTMEGARVCGLEARLGYAHRGVLGLMRGKSVQGAARLAARIDGAATVAHAVAFARAVEAASGAEVPPRGAALRTVLLALERVAVRLHDLHAVAAACGAAWPALPVARERLLTACEAVFGHRLLMDGVRPGGAPEPVMPGLAGLDAALAAVPALARRWPRVGVLPVGAAIAWAPGGVVGRASGQPDGVRGAVLAEGDLAARMRLTALALADDVAVARAGLQALPAGEAGLVLSHAEAEAEGLGVAEGPQGPVWHWVRLANGVVADAFAVAPGWLHLPALERATPGLAWSDVPAVAASFGVGVAGMDL